MHCPKLSAQARGALAGATPADGHRGADIRAAVLCCHILVCLAVFHSPDGGEIRVDTHHIIAVRPVEALRTHAPGVKTLIYVTGQTLGVTETVQEVDELITGCVGEEG